MSLISQWFANATTRRRANMSASVSSRSSAGELGEPFGTLYPSSGSNLSEALCFGQIAAETAALTS